MCLHLDTGHELRSKDIAEQVQDNSKIISFRVTKKENPKDM